MKHLPYQHPDELLYGEFQANELKPRGILDYLIDPPKPIHGEGLLGMQPMLQNTNPTTLLECLGLEEY